MSYLSQRNDFPELVDLAASRLEIDPAIVEKDYFVTEALREIVTAHGTDIIFKGGTSLSKGWGLINRFSEDIDLYIDPKGRGTKARNTLLKAVIAATAKHPAFAHEPEVTGRINGIARSARLHYEANRTAAGIKPSVLVELGIQSGTFPTESCPIISLLAQQLIYAGTAPNQEDCQPFDVTLLHFRRTFVEKMFAIHDKVARGLLIDGEPISTYARHYYDLSQLLPTEEVQAMLNSAEYAEIVRDYHQVTSHYFPSQAFPKNLELATSPALFPPGEILTNLSNTYKEQCEILCHGDYPPLIEVLERFKSIGHLLIAVEP